MRITACSAWAASRRLAALRRVAGTEANSPASLRRRYPYPGTPATRRRHPNSGASADCAAGAAAQAGMIETVQQGKRSRENTPRSGNPKLACGFPRNRRRKCGGGTQQHGTRRSRAAGRCLSSRPHKCAAEEKNARTRLWFPGRLTFFRPPPSVCRGAVHGIVCRSRRRSRWRARVLPAAGPARRARPMDRRSPGRQCRLRARLPW